ncbi:hypothetical protein BDW59DRAFT_140879 [Aspergillus cavernicola]|uniref:Uncharacterized protein n=1 Tax=Aspergillus cavernicola TaxID=176166 RepID=A0ABR4ISV5_9EURO
MRLNWVLFPDISHIILGGLFVLRRWNRMDPPAARMRTPALTPTRIPALAPVDNPPPPWVPSLLFLLSGIAIGAIKEML